LAQRGKFNVLEVRRGSDYNFCYGMIEFGNRPQPCWVVLGLEINVSHWSTSDSLRSRVDLNYTDAERLLC
jgi:hypothetical protein